MSPNLITELKGISLTNPEEEMLIITDEPKIPGYLCFPNGQASKKYNTKEVFGQGYDPSRLIARVKSIGECLERLCLINPRDLVVSNCNPSFVDPALFYCCSSEQEPEREAIIEHLRKERYHWIKAQELISKKKVLIPAQLVFLNEFDKEPPIRKERISTGAALNKADTNKALLTGFLEVIERDACIYSYLTKRKLKRITNLPKDTQNLVNYLDRYNLETHIFDAASDLDIPTVIAITIDNTGIGPAINIGSSAALNYKDAVKHALLESIHCRRSARLMKEIYFPKKTPNENEITSMDNRFFYWYELKRMGDISFWLNNNETVSYKSLTRKNLSFEDAIRKLKERGFHIFVVDITLPEIENAGYEAIKVLIPELHPLYLDERAKSLHSKHYGEIKDDKSLKPHPLT